MKNITTLTMYEHTGIYTIKNKMSSDRSLKQMRDDFTDHIYLRRFRGVYVVFGDTKLLPVGTGNDWFWHQVGIDWNRLGVEWSDDGEDWY